MQAHDEWIYLTRRPSIIVRLKQQLGNLVGASKVKHIGHEHEHMLFYDRVIRPKKRIRVQAQCSDRLQVVGTGLFRRPCVKSLSPHDVGFESTFNSQSGMKVTLRSNALILDQ